MSDLLTEITRAAKADYAQASIMELTSNDLNDWVVLLVPARWEEACQCGFAAAPPAFLRYCLEWRGCDMWSLMAAQLSVGAFEPWAAHGQFNGDLPPWDLAR